MTAISASPTCRRRPEFNYYIAIGEGIKAEAAANGVETFMLAPQSGADIKWPEWA